MQTEGGMNLLCLRDASIKACLADGMCGECANCGLDIRMVTERVNDALDVGKRNLFAPAFSMFCCGGNVKRSFVRRDRSIRGGERSGRIPKRLLFACGDGSAV